MVVDHKARSLFQKILLVAIGSVCTVAAGKLWSCGATIADDAIHAQFITTAQAGKMQEEYRGLVNDTRNTEHEHYSTIVAGQTAITADLEVIKRELATIHGFIAGAQSAPSGQRFNRGRPTP